MNITELVSKHDPENQFEVLVKSYQQIEFVKNNSIDLSNIDVSKIKNLIITGLGGSAIGGDLLVNVFKEDWKIPVTVNRNYNLPSYADSSTLIIASSYSGNTEETLAAVKDALNKGCQIICITTGGQLEYIATENNLALIKLKTGFQPRYALYINIFTLINIAQILKFIPEQHQFIDASIKLLQEKGKKLSSENNSAFKIAESLCGYIPVIYSVSDETAATGNRLKCQLNENSKLHAFHNVFPEMNHNEIIGWETFIESQFNCKTIILYDKDYNERNRKRIEITSGLINKAGSEIIKLESEESDRKLRLIDIAYLGDWISYYLALVRGYDPSEIDNIHYLKNQLAENNP